MAPQGHETHDASFVTVPVESIPRPQVGGSFAGVRLPTSVPFFDCRWPGDRDEPRSPTTGLVLWGSERAELALGNVEAGLVGRHAHPLGTITSWDAGEERHAARTAAAVAHLRSLLARAWRDYRAARRCPAAPGEGGSVAHRPAAIVLTNFGTTVLADLDRYRTSALHPRFGGRP